MKPVLKTSLIALTSAVVGGAIVAGIYAANPSWRTSTHAEQKNEIVFDDFFGHGDPFEEMRKIRQQMESRTQNFDSWFSGKFGGGSVYDISQKEDEDAVYYEIQIDDLQTTSVNAKVEMGHITITGSLEKREDGLGSTQSFSSNFQRTFPLPENVDADKMEMTPEKDKIVIKFPKLNS